MVPSRIHEGPHLCPFDNMHLLLVDLAFWQTRAIANAARCQLHLQAAKMMPKIAHLLLLRQCSYPCGLSKPVAKSTRSPSRLQVKLTLALAVQPMLAEPKSEHA